MDDTVLLATSRAAMQRKLELLYNSVTDIDMEMHPAKSEYIVLNCNDRNPFTVGNISISHTEKYVYLGSPISTKSIADQVQDHIRMKQGHINKFQSFVNRHENTPYAIKYKVLQAALNSALLYSCESWLTNNLRCVDTAVDTCIKSLLGVRNQIQSDIIHAETDIPTASAEIKTRQKKFLAKLQNRSDIEQTPVGKALQLAAQENSPMWLYVQNLERTNSDIIEETKLQTKQRILTSTGTRMTTYRQINSELNKHRVYELPNIPDTVRVDFTRLRLSSHYLRIETGRWTRLARHERTCICGEIQTEEHVLCYCPETADIRAAYRSLNYTSMQELMSQWDVVSLVNYCSDTLKKMNRNY